MIECVKCGLCCKKAWMLQGFPEQLNTDGSCVHLQPDNSCGIYEQRPDICNSNLLYERLFSEITPKEYHRLNADACRDMMKEAGMPVPHGFGTHYEG